MKNVYFIQVDVSSSLGAQSAYLPYAVGILAANAWTSDTVKRSFVMKEFIFLREEIGAVVSRMEDPAIAAFSNYCWNTEYNKALARAVKERFPACVTVFGGHNVPNDFRFWKTSPILTFWCTAKEKIRSSGCLKQLRKKKICLPCPIFPTVPATPVSGRKRCARKIWIIPLRIWKAGSTTSSGSIRRSRSTPFWKPAAAVRTTAPTATGGC